MKVPGDHDVFICGNDAGATEKVNEILKTFGWIAPIDLCYRSQPFTTEAKRMEFLFELYEKYTAGLFAEEKTKKSKSKETCFSL